MSNSGLRVLSEKEVGHVAGSSIVVTGQPYNPWVSTMSYDFYMANYYVDPYAYQQVAYADTSGSTGAAAEDPENSEVPEFDEEAKAAAQAGLEGLQADLENKLKEFAELGYDDFDIILGDERWSARELTESLGKLSGALDAYEAWELSHDLITGDADLADALGFVTAFAVTAGLAAAGAPAIVVLAASIGLGLYADDMYRSVGNAVSQAYDAMVQQIVDSPLFQNVDPNQPNSVQEYNWWIDLLSPYGSGWHDDYQGSSNQPPANSPYGYIDPALAAYYQSLNPSV